MHLRRSGAIGAGVGALPRRSVVPAVAALRSATQPSALHHQLNHVYVRLLKNSLQLFQRVPYFDICYLMFTLKEPETMNYIICV